MLEKEDIENSIIKPIEMKDKKKGIGFDQIAGMNELKDILKTDVIDVLKYINCNIVDIINRNYSFEYKCPQIASLIQKWQTIHRQYL